MRPPSPSRTSIHVPEAKRGLRRADSLLRSESEGADIIGVQFGEEACNLSGFMPVRRSVFCTNPHPTVMKNVNLWAAALLISVGLSSCALSYPYCDAYNGVEFEQAPADEASAPTEAGFEH